MGVLKFGTLGLLLGAVGFYSLQSLGGSSPKDEAKLDAACIQLAELLKPGDIVFLEIDNFLYRRVAKGTLSWTSHVGIALPGEGGEWLIYESAIMRSKANPLCEYLNKSKDYRFAIGRLPTTLSAQEIGSLQQAAEQRLDVLYGFGFDFDSDRQFCSKFVYQVYKEALGVEIGEIQTFKDLLEANPEGDTAFWRAWFLGRIPWERRTVTPASQLLDEDLEIVFESH